jgi:hypothetical protein
MDGPGLTVGNGISVVESSGSARKNLEGASQDSRNTSSNSKRIR